MTSRCWPTCGCRRRLDPGHALLLGEGLVAPGMVSIRVTSWSRTAAPWSDPTIVEGGFCSRRWGSRRALRALRLRRRRPTPPRSRYLSYLLRHRRRDARHRDRAPRLRHHRGRSTFPTSRESEHGACGHAVGHDRTRSLRLVYTSPQKYLPPPTASSKLIRRRLEWRLSSMPRRRARRRCGRRARPPRRGTTPRRQAVVAMAMVVVAVLVFLLPPLFFVQASCRKSGRRRRRYGVEQRIVRRPGTEGTGCVQYRVEYFTSGRPGTGPAVKRGCNSGSPRWIVTPPPVLIEAPAIAQIIRLHHVTDSTAPSRSDHVSGFWRSTQRSWQPDRNRTRQVPGPSTPLDRSQE